MFCTSARSNLFSVVCFDRIVAGMLVAIRDHAAQWPGGLASQVSPGAYTEGRARLRTVRDFGVSNSGVVAAADAVQDFCGYGRRVAVSATAILNHHSGGAISEVLHRR